MPDSSSPSIRVTENGPYLVDDGLAIRTAAGEMLDAPKRYALCRCGGSANKPFCDGTHNTKPFDGTETADRGPIAARGQDYHGHGVTIHDDRSVCAHIGYCTGELPSVFKLKQEPWVDAAAADADAIVRQVNRCPSGALSASLDDSPELVELDRDERVEPLIDGPYAVIGGVAVQAADGGAYEVRNRQALCRCGNSTNKPFCSGQHWNIGFKAP